MPNMNVNNTNSTAHHNCLIAIHIDDFSRVYVRFQFIPSRNNSNRGSPVRQVPSINQRESIMETFYPSSTEGRRLRSQRKFILQSGAHLISPFKRKEARLRCCLPSVSTISAIWRGFVIDVSAFFVWCVFRFVATVP